MKYFIYTRKSTDSEERQILSIESQISELKEFAAKEKLEIVQSERVASAGGRKGGVWGEFRPPYKFRAKSVRIFSNAHRQLVKEEFGSPAPTSLKLRRASTRARQPILSAKLDFLSLPRYCGAGQKRASSFLIGLFSFYLLSYL